MSKRYNLRVKTTRPVNLDEAPWLARVRPLDAIRLHPRQASESLDPGSSKMGWPFLWPEDEPWPVCHEPEPEMASACEALTKQTAQHERDETLRTMLHEARNGHNLGYLPVLQLKRSEFPELPFPGDSDVLQLLWCPGIHFSGDGGYLLFWRRAKDLARLRADPPPAAHDLDRVTPCVLDPERFLDYPRQCDAGTNQNWNLGDEDLNPAPGTKLFGFPNWVQNSDHPSCPRCAAPMKLLIEISSLEFGRNKAYPDRWVPYDDVENSSCDANTPPHDWMIGDNGEAYLFYCPNCPGEFTSRVQCM
jgi:hypothetical protein